MFNSRNKLWMIISLTLVVLLVASITFSGCKTEEAPAAETEEAATKTEEASTSEAESGGTFEDTELVIQGSDTLLEVSQNWAEAFMNENPGVNISVTGGGSGTGIAALINGTVDLANASRGIKDKEIDEAKTQGLDVQEHVVAWDGISVVINKDNPVSELSIEQISKIFTGEITNWSEVGGNDAAIVVASRDSSSGTYGYFKERVVQMDETMEENDYTQDALFLASNSAIREEVSGNENAIGYIGLGYLDDSVKAVNVIGEGETSGVTPSIENVQNKSYPISRPLYVYSPNADLTDLEQAFLDFAMGADGQAIALDIGFVPLGTGGDAQAEETETKAFEDTELVIQGSDTLLEVSQNWAEAFMGMYSDVNISVTGGGSGTGIAALINGTVDLANASRGIKDKEIDEAKTQGLDVQEHVVAWDGISVVISKDNPVDELSIEQVSKIYTGEITNWSEVGGNDADIVVTSRDSSSGTFGYFKERVVQMDKTMEENDYTQQALFLASNSAIREEVSGNENAIGYIGLGYLDDSVKAVAVIGEDATEGVAPSIENVQNGSYPISRPLYVYAPDADLTDLEQAFLDFAMGADGQAIALDIGFVPLS